jgi:hypothetical protein
MSGTVETSKRSPLRVAIKPGQRHIFGQCLYDITSGTVEALTCAVLSSRVQWHAFVQRP